jgi:hypothetical protein
MSESSFLGFGQFTRPDIGLTSDNFSNLAEIFESDKDTALRNIRLDPSTLDSLYGLSEDLVQGREDLRSASGLDSLLLTTLHQLTEIFLDRIPTRLNINKDYYKVDYPLGGLGSPSVRTDNVVIYNGSLQCEGLTYRANTIGSSLFSNPVRQNVAMSTSRASLFNSELETSPALVGYFKTASYSGSVRVRRRSHVDRIFMPKTSFLAKSSVPENPTHSILLNVKNGGPAQPSTPVKLLATKNTPLRVYCRMAVGQIKITFVDGLAPYFYGFQIQPAQQRPNSIPVEFLPVTPVTQAIGQTEPFVVNIDITSTGYQNLYDLYLYLYVNPEKVKAIEFSGIDIREFPDRKDLGLVGFNNLESLKISGGSMTILPLWLKTLSLKLKSLDLSDSGDTWRSGPMGWFDIRNPSATPSSMQPFGYSLYTAVSYLTVPQKGVLINESVTDWNGSSGSGGSRITGKFEKYVKNLSRTSAGIDPDYREFSALESLNLNDRFYGFKPRFDDVFPKLTALKWNSPFSQGRNYKFLFGGLPKLNNSGGTITYNINGSGADGSITDVGKSTDPANPDHVSKYSIGTFDIGGKDGLANNITGYINDPTQDWSKWRDITSYIDINRTGVSINLQESGTWANLSYLEAPFSGGARFTNPSSVLRAPRLIGIELYGSNTDGIIPQLGSTADTGALKFISLGNCNSLSAEIDNGVSYLLPAGFAAPRPAGSEHLMERINLHYLGLPYRFRRSDLVNLNNLKFIYCVYTALTGKFPVFPLKLATQTSERPIDIYIENSNFYDLTTLSISPSNPDFSSEIRTISAWSQNISGRGTILPSFEGTSRTKVEFVNISNSLTSTYPLDWQVVELRGAVVRDSDPDTLVSGLSIDRSGPDGVDKIYTLTNGSSMEQKVMVNDIVRDGPDGAVLAKVLSVSNTTVIISSDIPDPIPSTLYFARSTVDISGWFASGFSELGQMWASNCRLSGTLEIKSGFSKVVNSSNSAVNFSNNAIKRYVAGSLGRIFSSASRQITVDLSNNNLGVEVIQRIIGEVVDLDRPKRFRNCLVRLSGNKISASGRYSNYSQQEIFPTSTDSGGDVSTSLFRNEQFTLFNETVTVDEDNVSTTLYTSAGTRTIQIAGAFISSLSSYYKTQINSTQRTTESALARNFKSLTASGIFVDLGFTYISPNTSPVVSGTTYVGQVTRTGSITETLAGQGFTESITCPAGVNGASCWRNPTAKQILRLNT